MGEMNENFTSGQAPLSEEGRGSSISQNLDKGLNRDFLVILDELTLDSCSISQEWSVDHVLISWHLVAVYGIDL